MSNITALEAALQEVEAVLHCAGPFVHTFRPMVMACLRTHKHYIDISGEIEEFEALASLDAQAQQAGITLLPGAGFDVAPSDCLSGHLKQRLPTATHLRLCIHGVGAGVSRGTVKSAIENLHRQGRIRRNGQIVSVPPAWNVKKVDFGRGPVTTVSIGWGDVATAYYSTGIPNVETYMAFPRRAIDFMSLSRWLGPLLYTRTSKTLLKWMVDTFLPAGPSAPQRQKGLSILLGEVNDDQGRRAITRLQTPEGYSHQSNHSHHCAAHPRRGPQAGIPDPWPPLWPGLYPPIRWRSADRPCLRKVSCKNPLFQNCC
ncbi:MAG: saccharopine dehydrogenase family protein [Anaerolineae bacterium]